LLKQCEALLANISGAVQR